MSLFKQVKQGEVPDNKGQVAIPMGVAICRFTLLLSSLKHHLPWCRFTVLTSSPGLKAEEDVNPSPYYTLDTLVARIDSPARDACAMLLAQIRCDFPAAAGSAHVHHAWPAGYFDHITEVMNIAYVLYETLHACRPLPFSLSDALLVLFVHDLEKPWKYGGRVSFATKAERATWRLDALADAGLSLSADQLNALRYVEGENDDYQPGSRVMGPLAAFCHSADTLSARLWHDAPRVAEDPWVGARRHGAR